MMIFRQCLFIGAILIIAAYAHAQPGTGTIGGAVKAGKDLVIPVAGATVVVEGTDLAVTTDLDGTYRIDAVPAGAHILRVEAAGYIQETLAVEVRAGAETPANIGLRSLQIASEVIVVTASRSQEKVVDSPAPVDVVTESDLRARAGVSYLTALADQKSINYSSIGLSEYSISARGFDVPLNPRMLTMVDGRVAQLPGLGSPQGVNLPNSALDLKAIEIVVGPASALYGPNAHTGVVNITTKSPWDESGAAVSVRGGTQNLIETNVRLAGTKDDAFGWKFNASYMSADDFQPDPDLSSHYYSSIFEGDIVDYDLNNVKADGALYYRLGQWQVKMAGGYSNNDGFILSNAARIRLRDWQVNYQSVEVSGERWYAHFTRTSNDAGDSFRINGLAGLLSRTGGVPDDPAQLQAAKEMARMIDRSQLWDTELQYRDAFAGVATTAGLQYRRYLPASNGTYLSDSDTAITANEMGGYVQADYPNLLNQPLRLIGAVRLDHHSDYPFQVSPKIATVWTVRPGHNMRATYARAFRTPSILHSHLLTANGIGNRTGYEVRDSNDQVLFNVSPLSPEEANSFEIGYKGLYSTALFVDLSAYYSYYDGFISPLRRLADPAAEEPTFGYFPDGTLVGEGLLATYVNFGSAQVAGADAGVTYYPLQGIKLDSGASVISLVDFTAEPGQNALMLNSPNFILRGSIASENLVVKNSFTRLAARYRAAYEFEAGIWDSAKVFPSDGKIPARVVLDFAAGYYHAKSGVNTTLTVANILGNRDVDILGSPVQGRLILVEVGYRYHGLRY